ncbi:uncharacterized protein LOC113328134 [Papaver somniferum]|uniref:uncharacterized protein LOC113328134 n=1 Tax=Papaver somniferum TaxID=3469 RepID=UPI000E6FFB5D|nr:uncharacterized protein LOC113328134 [Papaver somniferum]
MTKEYVILPEPKMNFNKHKYRWNGFGYVPSTNEYKVVLMYKVPNFVEVMMYTLGSGNGWRNIGKFQLKMNYVFKGHGIFLNGALHWGHSTGSLILVFDLADEIFREHLLSPPPQPRSWLFKDLGVSNGFLFCASAHRSYIQYKRWDCDIWIYKKKNDNEQNEQYPSLGWTKEFILSEGQQPLAFTKSGGVLIYGSNYL